MAAIICAGLFYEVDYILAYILSSDHAAEEVHFYDDFFSVLLLAITAKGMLHIRSIPKSLMITRPKSLL